MIKVGSVIIYNNNLFYVINDVDFFLTGRLAHYHTVNNRFCNITIYTDIFCD
jgi:hypothetical protein